MKAYFLLLGALLFAAVTNAQLQITTQNNGQALAQRLVGDGVTISNVTLSGDSISTGFFKNISGTNIGIDSGIVLTNGRAKTQSISDAEIGLDGDGATPANDWSGDAFANNEVNWDAHDTDLEQLLGIDPDATHDATVLEFDFVPIGDTIKFKYVFSSEEYPEFACPTGGTLFNDAFAFFIQGPGYPVKTNIALIPGTNDPVSIHNINGEGCAPYPQYYFNNEANVNFTHNGHTVVMTVIAHVQPCQSYHLKLVIADVEDASYDSGVFLEAKSLTSNAITLSNNTQTDVQNNSYIVEGCINGSFTVKRPHVANYPLDVRLSYGGTAINGVDVQTLPALVTFPANDTVVVVNVIPIVDNLVEGIEQLKVYASPGCGSVVPVDSTLIQIRDYDTLTIAPHNAYACHNGSIQITASYNPLSTYQWDAEPGLNNYTINNPVATPTHDGTTYICTAILGNCHGRDSVLINWKQLEFVSSSNVNCHDAATGQIIVDGGPEWQPAPISYWVNTQAPQASGTFNNLIVGDYMVHISDGTGCIDSLPVTISQAYPDLLITDTALTASSCTAADGSITITAGGGKPPYRYSIDGTNYQSGNIFTASANTYTIHVMDANNCHTQMTGVTVPFLNGLTLTTGSDPTICESESTQISAVASMGTIAWTTAIPAQISTLSNPTIADPVANPTVTTTYYVTCTLGVCSLRDSVTVFVNPAPVPDAGDNVTVCYGGQTQLNATGAVDYHWSPSTYLSNPDINNPIVSQAQTTIYHLSVVDANGCHSLVTDEVTVTVLPPAQLFAGYDTIVAMNQPLALHAVDINHIGFTQYTWSPATGLNNPFIANPLATLTAPVTDLVVIASTPDNCIGTDTIKVTTYRGPEIYVPNSFTPNGDGLNDVLRPITVGIKTFHFFNVYNRYGQLIFSSSNEKSGWDGKYKGVLQNLNTFVWIAEAVDYKGNLIQRKGTTTIIQ